MIIRVSHSCTTSSFKYLSNCESIPFLTIQPGYQYLCSTFQTVSSLSFYTSLYPFLFWNWECDIVSPIKLWLFPCLDLILLLSENLSRSYHFYMSCQPLGKWATESVENPCKTKLCPPHLLSFVTLQLPKVLKVVAKISPLCLLHIYVCWHNWCQTNAKWQKQKSVELDNQLRNQWFLFFEPSINRTRPF